MSLVRFGSPNCGLMIWLLTDTNVTRLRTLVASMRQSMLMRSPMRNVRATEAFIENCEGPVIELRDAVPHSPAAGTANAAGFAYVPSAVGSGDVPVRLGRDAPMMPVAPTGEK